MTAPAAVRTAWPWPQLRPYQVEAGRAIVRSVLRGEGQTISVMMARQAGKNELSAQMEALLLARHLGRAVDAVKCAPTFHPQAQISLRRLWTRLHEAGLGSLATKEEGYIIRLGYARQLFLSAEPHSNVVGHTAQILLEADESQDIDPEKFDRDFRPMAATTNATTVYYGTAWDEASLLEQAKERHLEMERRDGVRRHFQYDWEQVARHNPDYGRYVEAERARLGENHPLFLTQYCLRTISGGRLFTASQRAQLQGTHPRQQAPDGVGEAYVAGLDIGGQDLTTLAEAVGEPLLAASGHDATVLTIARVIYSPSSALAFEPRLEVVEQRAWTSEPHERLVAALADLLGNVWRVRRVEVDATGLGETIARFLTRALRRGVVIPFRFTAEAKSRLGYELLAAVNTGRLKVYAADGSPECRQFWREAELARVAYRPNRTMNFYVDPSQGHDDYLISLALAVAAAQSASDGQPRAARSRLQKELWV